jgi:hypothetical protein
MQNIWTLTAGRISTPSEKKTSLIQPFIQPVVTKLPTMSEICCHYITQLGDSQTGLLKGAQTWNPTTERSGEGDTALQRWGRLRHGPQPWDGPTQQFGITTQEFLGRAEATMRNSNHANSRSNAQVISHITQVGKLATSVHYNF